MKFKARLHHDSTDIYYHDSAYESFFIVIE